MNRSKHSAASSFTLLMWFLAWTPTPYPGDTGDVLFSLPDQTIFRHPSASPDLSTEVLFHVEGLTDLPARAWSVLVQITRLPGSTGSIKFNPPASAGEPNLNPAMTNPFLDFDRDFGGVSNGFLGASDTELESSAAYIPPAMAPPPPLDLNGNLTLPDGSGRATIPIQLTSAALGDFSISIGGDSPISRVVFQSDPNSLESHPPTGTHVSGTISVVEASCEFNDDGDCNTQDIQLMYGDFDMSVPPTNSRYDLNADNSVELVLSLTIPFWFGSSMAAPSFQTCSWPLVIVTVRGSTVPGEPSALGEDMMWSRDSPIRSCSV